MEDGRLARQANVPLEGFSWMPPTIWSTQNGKPVTLT